MRRAFALVLVGAIAGCRTSDVGPYTPPTEGARETTVAEKLNREAADLIATDPAKAEAILREALTKDLFYGPAHNNLGVVFLGQDKLYEAANEFEWARKLMPGHPDPHVNLAIVMEHAGREADAFRSYEAALAAAPECVGAMQGASRQLLAHGRSDERLATWLDTVAIRGETPQWREWAAMKIVAR